MAGLKSVYEAPCFGHCYPVNRGAPPGALGQGFKNLKGLCVSWHPIGIQPLIDFWDDVGCIAPGAEPEATGCAG